MEELRLGLHGFERRFCIASFWGAQVLGGSGDLVSKVISPLIGVISNYKYRYLIYNPSY